MRRLAIMALGLLTSLGAAQAENSQSDLCANPNAFCGRMVTGGCLTRFGAGSVAAATAEGECGVQLGAYYDCVASAAEECGAGSDSRAQKSSSRGGCDADLEKDLWDIASGDNNCDGYGAFLESCPSGKRAPFARARQKALSCAGAKPAKPSGGQADAAPICGWFAISACEKDPAIAARKARKHGGEVIETGAPKYPKFNPGWHCVVRGPTDKAGAEKARRELIELGVPDAYIKNSC